MKAMSTFTSKMAPHIERYLALKQALGREYDGVRRLLVHLDQFLTTHGGDLTAETFGDWCLTLQHLASGTRRARMREVRNFCIYRGRYEAASFIPDSRLFPPRHQVVRPHLFTNEEVHGLLAAIGVLPAAPTSRFRRENLRLAVVILYTTELVRLTLRDYDPCEHTLLIRDSKFHKSRLVPLSIDGTREIDQYLEARRSQRIAISPESPLLWHHTRGGTAYTGAGLTNAIRPLLRALQIRTETGRLPRVHDFRHTFALEALLRWYRSGADVQAKLPLLATYMGHVSIASTEYYLKSVEPLGVSASERFARHCSGVLAMPANTGGVR